MRKIFKRFSHWLHFQPPGAMTSKGWRLFRKEFREKAPIRYWFTNDFRHKVTLPIRWKYEAIRNWIRYRTYDRYHVVNTGLPPGYYGVEKRLLHSSFNLLKDFVEVEMAWRTYWWSDEAKNASWFEKHLPFYRVFKPFRSREHGLAHLNWAATLDDPNLPPHERCDHQAVSAREIRELYLWWVDTVPSRKEVDCETYDHQGCDMGPLDDDFDENAPDYKKFREAMDSNSKLEEQWNEEDTQMFIRLVKVRAHLWT